MSFVLPASLRAGAWPASRLIFYAALAFTGLDLPAVAAAAPATHVLYMGAEFSVEWRGKKGRVVDVDGESLVIEVDGKRTPLRNAATQLGILMESTMKIGRDAAELSGVEGTNVFSEANNPHRASEQGAAMANDASAVADLRAFNLRETERATGATEVTASMDPVTAARLSLAQDMYRDSLHAQNSPTHSTVGQPQAAGAGYDAFQLSFTVAAPRVLHRPYAMVAVRILEQPGNPKTLQARIYPLPLARVDTKPRRYHLLRAGLPAGYQLERYTIHLFEDGKEIATSASSKRVELTSEDAFQFALVSHLTDSRDATQAPSPAREFWPGDLADRLSAGNRNRLIFVQVDKNGLATGAFHDEAGKLRIDEADISAVLPHLHFFPALKTGKAVPGICRVHLSVAPL